ncbi:hypothetical protein [Streptomyces hiroshimensis]|uniref:Uncharacterized protein n=1 Tax=Streptomyces hiroshimensis TaxID=66424 RepID=A0ABQ2YAG3_9ACTN|nr:hypothetical protein [Streptomyces hiroshimensis]GGX76307.1 hypothetical protein GCM10010324_22460 [Streptomyces hiroshimensis]
MTEESRHARASWWALLAVVLGVPLFFAGRIAYAIAVEDDGDPFPTRSVGCGRALSIGEVELPPGATRESCQEIRGWQDYNGWGTFRMPRENVSGWLGKNFPEGSRPCQGDPHALCARNNRMPEASAEVRFEDKDTAVVAFETHS